MQIGRFFTVVATIAVLWVSGVPAQDKAASPAITKVTPTAIVSSDSAVDVTVEGRNFARKAVVRARVAGTKGGGVDCATAFESEGSLRATIPADLLRKPASLELRVKNPDESVSPWVALDVRERPSGGGPAGGPRKPIIDRISPVQVQAGSQSVHVSIFGRELKDGSTVTLRSGSVTATTVANLVSGHLVFQVPDELLDQPRTVLFQIETPDKQTSDKVQLDVVAAGPTPLPPGGGVAISQVNPASIDLAGSKSQRIEIIGLGIDEKGSRVLLRQEGSTSDGQFVPVVGRSTATNGIVLNVDLTPAMVREDGAYEVRVVNPDGRQSNWFRLQVTGGGAGGKTVDARVTINTPASLTLTASSVTIPLEMSVENTGTTAIRLNKVALLTPDRKRVEVTGTIEVPVRGKKSARLEAPAPLGLGAGMTKPVPYRFTISYDLSSTTTREAPVSKIFPEADSISIAIRNEIVLAAIGRDYVAAATPGGAEGWRFFKQDNPTNADTGKNAEFFLFPEMLGPPASKASEELVNYRPDESAPDEKGIFYLVLRGSENLAGAGRKRERGTRLGFIATAPSEGLVPLYRWVRTIDNRPANHYLSLETDRGRLPRQMQTGNWALDGVVGYVVARSSQPSPR